MATPVRKRSCPYDQNVQDNKSPRREPSSPLEADTTSAFQRAQEALQQRPASPLHSSTGPQFSSSNPAPHPATSSQTPSLGIPVQNSTINDSFALATKLYSLKKYNEAIEQSSKVPKTHPGFGQMQLFVGLHYFNVDKNYSKAVDHFSKMPEIGPELTGIKCYWLGFCYYHLKNYQRAEEFCSLVGETHTYFGTAQIVIGNCYHDQKNYAKAIEHYSKVPESHSSFGSTQFFIGDCYVSMAREHFNNVPSYCAKFQLAQSALEKLQ